MLDLSASLRPVKDGLSLPPPTSEIPRLAVFPNRRHVSRDRTPASNLPKGSPAVLAAHVVAGIPLEPPARILLVDPAARRQTPSDWEAFTPKQFWRGSGSLGAQPGAGEPTPWKPSRQSVKDFPPEDTEPQHLFGVRPQA